MYVGGVNTIVKAISRNITAQSKLPFTQAVSNNANFTVIDLPHPCTKGGSISIKIS